ncbi:MAG: RNA polymerase sigma factor [Muribaculaceae bacterium]|nr:RNA polymerase sigma factor [Muribaculaceae bacterium]
MFRKIRRKTVDEIIEDNLDYLVRFAYYRLNNKAEAEDIVYEGVLRLLEKDLSKINPESIRLYLFRIIYNLCQDRIRGKGRDMIPIESVDISENPDEPNEMDESDKFMIWLNSLPEGQSEIIRMNVIEELSFVEISEILSIPASTAKSRYKSGMEKLRKIFKATNN